LIALFDGHIAAGHDLIEQNLDVDLMVGTIHPAGVVDGIGIDASAALRKFHAGELREAEIAAFPDHLAAQLRGVDAQRVIATIAHVEVVFSAGLDEGADPAVPQ